MRFSIHVRPPEVAGRRGAGHWEGNLIKGADDVCTPAGLQEQLAIA